MRFAAIIFDFDGVLLESEYEGNRELAALLSRLGHPHSAEDTLRHYVGLAGRDFVAAIEARIGAELPQEFHDHMKQMSVKALRETRGSFVCIQSHLMGTLPSCSRSRTTLVELGFQPVVSHPDIH